MDESAAYRLEQLVAETSWLRRLARSLVADAGSADDVTHDTLLAAAQHSLPDDRPLRPWLARVARNVARMRGRSAARRATREARSASDETATRPDQLFERVEMQRLLTSYVLELESGDRDVILLHFFEGLSSAEIGRRLGIPDGTVRWRLKRGLDALRSRLDASGSKRGAWIAPVAALGRVPVSAGKVALVKKVLAIVILAIAMLAIGVAVWRGGSRAGEQGGGTSRSADIRAGARVPGWVIQPELAARLIAGHVVFRGVAVPSARVSLRIAQQPDVAIADVVSDDHGTFSFGAPPSAAYTVIARAPGMIAAIVEIDTHDPHAHPDRLELVLGECVARAVGTVSDAEGAPLAKARVGERGLVGVETDDHGRYELCRSASAVSVTFAASGFGSVTTSFEGLGEITRDIVLAPEGVILGRVVRAGSLAPIAAADVVATSADGTAEPIEIPPVSTKTSDDGRFQLGGLAPGRYRVGATAPGLGGALVETFVAGANTRELTIVVDERARVNGTVVSNGDPLEGVEVTSVGPAYLSGAAPVFSQHDGRFAIDGVPHGEVHWRVRGYRVLSPVATTVVGDRVEKVVLDVVPGRSIRGHVTRDGVAAVGATVRYWHLSWNGGFHNNLRTAITDALGAYTLDDVELGRTGVDAQTADAKSDGHIVYIGEDGAIVDMVLDQVASISGSVVDEHGVPVVGVD
ncbi:MAG TPA: sigma-70 family RNA polymerase sigma factor, partial [Kofleriaceae bacterium]|nr:sigma-70 family RNA polymerase sigma factor [Kofleriaceae bacterium]